MRNPSDTREFRIAFSSAGYENLQLSWAAMRTNNGADFQKIKYSADGGENWTLLQDSVLAGLNFSLYAFDLSAISVLNNNPNALLSIIFFGPNASGTSGNHRFDNFLLLVAN